MSENQTSTFDNFSHILNPIGRLNQQCNGTGSSKSNYVNIVGVVGTKK